MGGDLGVQLTLLKICRSFFNERESDCRCMAFMAMVSGQLSLHRWENGNVETF